MVAHFRRFDPSTAKIYYYAACVSKIFPNLVASTVQKSICDMKRIIITLAVLAGIGSASFAQNAQPDPAQVEASKKKMAEQMAERHTRELQRQYGLTEDQYKQAYEANLTFSQKMINNRNPTNKTVTPAEIQSIMDERDGKLKTIMTPEQYKQYDMVKPSTGGARNNQSVNR
jgi:hypothetical protein